MRTVRLPAKLECGRCGHRWLPRTADVRICPRCKTARWDTPRVVKTNRTPAPKPYLTAEDDPVLAKLWDNDYDAVYDDL